MGINRERVQLLVNELLTTDKEQGPSYLNANGRYCCLGIACEVAKANGCEVSTATFTAATGTNITAYDEAHDVLPPSVMEWYGFTSSDPAITYQRPTGIGRAYGRVSVVLATNANDKLFWDFRRIGEAFRDYYLDNNDT